MKTSTRFLILLIAIAVRNVAFATTFVVPTDREMVRRAGTIVVVTAGSSYTQLNREGGVETVTTMDIEEVIKGSSLGATIDVVEPGGTFGGVSMIIPGVPRFDSGQRMLLLLVSTGEHRWSVAELVLGKFNFASDVRGHSLLVRDEDEIVGWDSTLLPYRDGRRDSERFLRFVRTEASGGMGQIDYAVEYAPLSTRSESSMPRAIVPTVAPFTANSYTMTIQGTSGSRWNVFPNGVNWFSGTTQEPGAPGGGVTAITTGIASWNNDCGSNVNYVYSGSDNGTHTQGLHAADGANTVLFERDLSSFGVAPFSCSANGYSGTLGIGGITSASGTNTVGVDTFVTMIEGDVEMNKGIANCTLLFNNGDWKRAVTHELGHTLGFRHADQNRADNAACSSDPTLECSSSAIMTASITPNLNAALQTWDQHAVQAVYPGNVCASPPSCTPLAITQQPSSTTTTSGTPVNLSVGASGTGPLSFQWYVGASGNTASPISGATSSAVTVAPTTTTSYWVRVSNACGSANSATATVTVIAVATRHVRGDFDGDGKSDTAIYRPSPSGIWYISLSGTGGSAQVQDGGAAGDIIVPADGDGKTDVAIFRPATGLWYIINSASGTGRAVTFGAPGDMPVRGDYDGDGKADIAIYRPSNGVWFILYSSSGATTSLLCGGASGDLPVPADYDGDSKTDVAIFRPSTGLWYIINSSNGTGTSKIWGAPGDIPVPGDYDGDRRADVAVYRPSNGNWFISNSSNGSSTVLLCGAAGDTPVPGDYDGDVKTDVAIYRPSTGMWYMVFSGGGALTKIWGGAAGDVPTQRILTNPSGP